MLLEELATITNTAVNTEHATQIIATDHQRKRLERIEEANRVPIVVYDTDWKDEKVQPLSTEYRSSIENAQRKYPANIQYEQAKVNLPKSILSRERLEKIEHNNQEITQQIDQQSIPQDRSIERIETNNNLISNQNQSDTPQILSRERFEKIEHNNQEITQRIDQQSIPQDRSIERIETNNNLISNQNQSDTPQILCQPIDDQLQINDEQVASLSDDSLLVRHQQKTNVNVGEATRLEDPVRSTSFLTLNYAQHNQEITPPWQRAFDQQVFDHSRSQQQQVQIQTEQLSTRYLPSISSTENYLSEFHQTPLLHENVRMQDTERIHLVPSIQINQSRPIYRVRQQQISSNDDHDYSPISSIHPDHIDRINTTETDSHLIGTIHVEPPPITVDIELRARPALSETSSLDDMETALNRFEENLDPEQHLPLVDQISLSYTTSLRSIQDGTQRAIERYEQEHPYFSRALPSEWIQPTVFPHDEQLVEQWIVEKNLETIQQQVELRTNNECESFVAAAIANDACFVGERFEEDVSNSLNTKTISTDEQNNPPPIPILVSHCSPTSDYETDSLDKDNDTTSTTTSIDAGLIVAATPMTITLPTQLPETGTTVPVEYLLDALANEPKDKNNITKDFLLTIGFGQNELKPKSDIHRAKVNTIEYDDNSLLFNFNDHQQELLNIFFEPAHLYLPIINEISIYQIIFHHEYPIFSPSNLSQPIIHNEDYLSSNEYQTNEQEIFSIAQINHQSDHEEDLENISQKYDSLTHIEHYQIQSLENFFVHVNEPPMIMEIEDEQSAASILPDVIPSTKQTEVMHGKRDAYMHVYRSN